MSLRGMRRPLLHGEGILMQAVFVIMILEMLCVNLYVSHICHERKASPVIVVPVMAGFTLLLVGLSALTIAALPGYGEGSFVIFGFLYVIPLALLYRSGIKLTVSVMCLSWSYTMLLFLFAQYLGQAFPEPAQPPAMLIIQTVAYGLTLRPFLRLLHGKLLYVIAHAQPSRGSMLLRLSLSTCALAFCASWELKTQSLAAKLALICVLAVNTVMMYQALYSLTKIQRYAVQTRQESLTDALTGLSNRRAFFEQAELLVREGRPFTLAFLDLNRFKSINDTYGHTAGDCYLRNFAREFVRQLASGDTLYRMAGDEFVLLREGDQGVGAMLEQVGGVSIRCADPDIPFLGFSCGMAAFPEDAGALDELLSVADRRMYRAKMDAQAPKNIVKTHED